VGRFVAAAFIFSLIAFSAATFSASLTAFSAIALFAVSLSVDVLCPHAVGYTQEDWHAYRVPSAAAIKVRSCFRRHGINE
jgi:hypothetical protein